MKTVGSCHSVHRGAARALGSYFTGPSVMQEHAALPQQPSSTGPAGRCRRCAQLWSGGGSLHTWRGLTSRTCRCPKEMQRAGYTSGARVWITPAPIVVIPTRIPRQPSKEVRGEAVLAAVVKSAAGRVSAQCRPVPGLRRGACGDASCPWSPARDGSLSV